MNSSMHRQRQQQQRSHSISGQELPLSDGYQRLNQFITQHVSPELDHHRQRYGLHQSPHFQQQQQQHLSALRAQAAARSPSPLSYAGHIDQSRDLASKYQPSNDQQVLKPRNQLHASLECLNSGYLEYQHQQQQQQLRHQQQQQMQLQNQHYAAATNYVLSAPPANSVVNQNGDHDLAAAAMMDNSLVAHHHQYHHPANLQQQQQPQPGGASQTANNIYAHQSLISRAMAQSVHQSPARRFSSAQHGVGSMTSNLINNLANNLHHPPMRAGHSSLSLSSSSYIIEDKLQNEIKKLHSELKSEREKNEALNSQLNINSNLMAAFEQSLTTLNSRLRQLTTINERKDQEIEELRVQVSLSKLSVGAGGELAGANNFSNSNASPTRPLSESPQLLSPEGESSSKLAGSESQQLGDAERNSSEGQREDLLRVIEALKKQLVEKDRLLTDTRLEALSAAHQLEQLESRLDKEHRRTSLATVVTVNDEDELDDEGVMVANNSPSDSAVTEPTSHFSEMTSAAAAVGQKSAYDHSDTPTTTPGARAVALDTPDGSGATNKGSPTEGSSECNDNNNNISIANNSSQSDNNSSHSSDYGHDQSAPANYETGQAAAVGYDDQTNNLSESLSQQFSNGGDVSPMDRLMDSLLSSAS